MTVRLKKEEGSKGSERKERGIRWTGPVQMNQTAFFSGELVNFRRGGRRPTGGAAAPENQNTSVRIFFTFLRILFRIEFKSGLRKIKTNSYKPRSNKEISKKSEQKHYLYSSPIRSPPLFPAQFSFCSDLIRFPPLA
uniref:Uncharacterized protein n=1 Tax=Medicago truncatula TaxID=3880 RepID=Q2HW88_MEDTR|nr:hypothetical protein MtrDRAFT_AC147774g3v1 [Medicago truncatula]